MTQEKKVSNKIINIGELALLAIISTSRTERPDEEPFKPWAAGLIPEIEESAQYETLREKKLIDDQGEVTNAGFKLLLNGTSYNPNFKKLATSDFNTAAKMFFTAKDALEQFVANSETGQIVPKKDTVLVEAFLSVANWIDNITETYQNSLKEEKESVVVAKTTKPKAAAKAAK